MYDIFLSYSSWDRERVSRIHNALSDVGFSVFWDQAVPAGTDWDAWIRKHLNESKCAIVAWSAQSIVSDNVRHEATIAKQQLKLVPVMLDRLAPEQFPMGLLALQAVDLSSWSGDRSDSEWAKLSKQIEGLLTPPWVRRVVDGLEAELIAERARREACERRDRTLRERIAVEAQERHRLQVELDSANGELSRLSAQIEYLAGRHAVDASRINDHSEERRNLDADGAQLSDELVDARLRTELSEQKSPMSLDTAFCGQTPQDAGPRRVIAEGLKSEPRSCPRCGRRMQSLVAGCEHCLHRFPS